MSLTLAFTMENTRDLLDEANKIAADLTSAEEKLCISALKAFRNLCTSAPDVVGSVITEMFEKFIPCLLNENEQVSMTALSVLCTIIAPLRDHLPRVVKTVIEKVATTLNIDSPEVNKMANKIFDELMEHLEPKILIQPFSVAGLKINKGKHFLVEIMCSLVLFLFHNKPKLIYQHALPLLWHVLDIPKHPRELKRATSNLVHNLYAFMGNNLVLQTKRSLVHTKARLSVLNDVIRGLP